MDFCICGIFNYFWIFQIFGVVRILYFLALYKFATTPKNTKFVQQQKSKFWSKKDQKFQKNVFFDLMDILSNTPSKEYDLLVSNPPYISRNEMNYLPEEVKNFEPPMALTDSADGLTFYHRLAKIGRQVVKVNGWIVLEVGIKDHPNKVLSIFKNLDYKNLELIKDLNGDNRVLIIEV